jgi:hypothetical protein
VELNENIEDMEMVGEATNRHRNHTGSNKLDSSVSPMETEAKHIVIIETPPTAARFIQVTCLMSGSELAQAKAERPDLIFRIPDHMINEKDAQEPPTSVEKFGTGMTLSISEQEELQTLIDAANASQFKRSK